MTMLTKQTQEPPAESSCYLCEIGTDGIFLPAVGRNLLICAKCVLESLWANPRLHYELKKKQAHDLFAAREIEERNQA